MTVTEHDPRTQEDTVVNTYPSILPRGNNDLPVNSHIKKEEEGVGPLLTLLFIHIITDLQLA